MEDDGRAISTREDVESLGRVPLFVGDGGLRLKENARVSTLLPGPG